MKIRPLHDRILIKRVEEREAAQENAWMSSTSSWR